MPAPPPIMQCAPMVALPAMPTQPAIAVCAPMLHVVADLDQVVELDAVLDHGVAERAAVDAGVGADLDVVADDARAPSCSIFSQRPLVGREAEAVGADAPRRGWTMQRAPIVQSGDDADARPSRVAAPMLQPRRRRVRADASRRRRSRRRPRSRRTAPIATSAPSARRGSIDGARMDAAGAGARACARPTTASGGRSRGTDRR